MLNVYKNFFKPFMLQGVLKYNFYLFNDYLISQYFEINKTHIFKKPEIINKHFNFKFQSTIYRRNPTAKANSILFHKRKQTEYKRRVRELCMEKLNWS